MLASYMWWAYLLHKRTQQLIRLKVEQASYIYHGEELLKEKKELQKEQNRQLFMLISEGLIFVLLLCIGAWQIRKSFRKELLYNKQQTNFLLSITHELKTPIASMQLSLQSLQRKSIEEKVKEKLLQNSLYDVERLKQLVDNILMVNRMEHAHIVWTLTPCNVSLIASQIVSFYNNNYAYKVSIESSIESECFILADELAISLVLHNLLSNALKYTTTNPIISLNVLKLHNDICIKVSDNGVGVAPDESQKIFERFYRVGNEETRTSKGSGLGLYLVKQIMLAHKGQVTYEPNSPQGSIFSLKFPADKG